MFQSNHITGDSCYISAQLEDTVKSLCDVGKKNFAGILLQQLQDARIPERKKRIKAKIMLSLHRRLARHREKDTEELRETSVIFKLHDIHEVILLYRNSESNLNS